MSALVVIQNKRHGSTSTVTQEEWEAMQKKGHGQRIFRVLSTTDIQPQPQPRKLVITMPKEAQEIHDRKNKPQPPEVQEIVATKAEQQAAPEVAEVNEAKAVAGISKPARKAKTGAAEAPKASA